MKGCPLLATKLFLNGGQLTNGVPHCLSMTDVSVKTLSQDVFDKFWSQKDHLSSRSIQMGLKYAVEGYIKDFKINLVGNKINLEARVYRSQCKREKPHVMVVTIADDSIQDQHCSCTAGYD